MHAGGMPSAAEGSSVAVANFSGDEAASGVGDSAHRPDAGRAALAGETDRGYLPWLDGLRGLSVALVLAFHLDFALAKGGFVGVSVFFTISGFIITRRLLDEVRRTGTFSYRSFIGRRARRLVPGALVVVLAATFVVGPAVGIDSDRLRGDALSAIAYVANWHFALDQFDYARLFSGASPLLHYWSLAIEEQYYLVMPALFAVPFVRSRFGATLATVWLLCTTYGLWLMLQGDHRLAYYSTVTRLAEIVAGALLAVAFARFRSSQGPPPPQGRLSTSTATGTGPLAAVALAAILVFAVAAAADDAWLVPVGFAGISLVTATVIWCAAEGSFVTTLLSWRPLVYLGTISYSLYLWHWPVILWLRANGPTSIGANRALATVLSLALAVASHRTLEQFFRDTRLVRGRRGALALPISMAACLVAVVMVASGSSESRVPDFEAARRDLQAALRPDAASNPPGGPADRARVVVLGDSTATMSAVGLAAWTGTANAFDLVGDGTALGCGVLRGGDRHLNGKTYAVTPSCDDWPELWPAAVRSSGANVALVQVGPWEVTDRLFPGDDVWRAPGDPEFDRRLRADIALAARSIRDAGATVIWLTSPYFDSQRGLPTAGGSRFSESEPARMDRLNEILDEVVGAMEGAAVVDLAGYLLRPEVAARDETLRPDGIHFTKATSTQVATDWLGPTFTKAAAELLAGSP